MLKKKSAFLLVRLHEYWRTCTRNYPGRWVGRQNTLLWPVLSADKLNFFMWGYVKIIIYWSSVIGTDDPKKLITDAIIMFMLLRSSEQGNSLNIDWTLSVQPSLPKLWCTKVRYKLWVFTISYSKTHLFSSGYLKTVLCRKLGWTLRIHCVKFSGFLLNTLSTDALLYRRTAFMCKVKAVSVRCEATFV